MVKDILKYGGLLIANTGFLTAIYAKGLTAQGVDATKIHADAAPLILGGVVLCAISTRWGD